MGDQKSKFTIAVDGDRLTGTNAGALGMMEVSDGKVAGDRITWKMIMTVPMPLTLDCDAVIEGDKLTGNVKAGPFGSMPMTGTRVE
jgi:hypothetical protein